jgi:integrase
LKGSDEEQKTTELTEADVLAPDEIKRLLDNSEDGFYRTLFMTAALTGARHDELLALQWGDIDLEAGKVWIRRNLSWAKVRGNDEKTKSRFYPPKTKSGNRNLPIASELVSALKKWKLQCPPSDHDLVFPSLSGQPGHRSNVLRFGLFPALSRAKLRRVNMHSLRHSFATNLLANNAPIAEVTSLMGHSNPTTTLKIYTHWVKKVDTGAVGNLAKSICEAPEKPTSEGRGHFLDTLGKSEAI